MPEQYTSEKRTIGQLLSRASPPIVVPPFQRSYSWDKSEIGEFWSDLTRFSNQYPGDTIGPQEYFLGSIVLVVKDQAYELLDGQQRLATATILLSVIRDYVRRYNADAATRTSSQYITEVNDATNTHTYSLTLNEYDRDFFRRLIQTPPREDVVAPAPSHESHHLIRKARDYFANLFESQYAEVGNGQAAYQWALRVREVLVGHMSLIAITSVDEDNAAMVFETLNDRGIGLSTTDLVRNLLLRRAREDSRQEIIDSWRVILNMDDEARVESFLRHFWLSREGDVKTRSLYREIRDHVVGVVRGQQVLEPLDFTRELQYESSIYRELAAGRSADAETQKLLQSINAMGGAIPFASSS